MSADARAIVRISALPDSSLRKAIAQTVGEAARAAKQAAAADIQAAKAAEREKIRAGKSAERAAKQASQSAIQAAVAHQRAQQKAVSEETRAVQRAAREQAREAERLAREQVKWDEWAEKAKYRALQSTTRAAERAAMQSRRESEKTARQQIRDAERVAQARRDSNRRVASAVGGAAVGVAVGTLGRARSYAGTFGAKSNEDMAAAAVDFKRRLAILGEMGGLDAKSRDAMGSKVLKTSARSGVDASDLLAGLETAQDRFPGALKEFTSILDQVADVSIATGTEIDSVVGAMGVMRRQFQLTDEEMQQLTGAMVTAADIGNVSFKSVADNFAGAMGSLGRNAGLQGLEGAIQALAISQTMGASDLAPTEVANRITNLMTAFSKQTVREAVAAPKSAGGFGVKLSDHGKIRDIPTILGELSAAGFTAPENSQRRGEAFKDVQAREAIEVLVTQFERDPETVSALLNMKTAPGIEAIQRRVSAANEGVLGTAATLGARQFQSFMESGEFDRFMEVTTKSADSLTQLEAKYPLIKEAVGIASDALKGLGAAILAERVVMGAGTVAAGGAAAAGAGAAAGVGAASATGAAAAGIGAAGVIGAAAVGVATYAATTAALDALGLDAKNIGSGLYDAFHYEPRSKTRGIGSGGAAAPEPLFSQAGDEDYQSQEPVPWTPASTQPAPLSVSQPQATLNIKIDGPARVTSIDSSGFDEIETTSVDTGRRTSLP